MTRIKHPRLIAPLSTLAVGSSIAVAVGIGYTWTGAIIAEIVVVLESIGYFALTGSKSDVGAIYGQRRDERQGQVLLRASRLAMIVMFAVVFVITLFTLASKGSYWQVDVVGSVGGVSYFIGLLIYGEHDESARGAQRGIMSSEVIAESSDNGVTPPL
jgi:hypothetical protein